MNKSPSLSESITSVLQESKSDLIKKLDALTKEFVELILKGEINNDDINEITGQFDGELYSARRKFNSNKIDPAKKAAAIEKGKATRAADRAADAARKTKTQAHIAKAKQMVKDGILPDILRKPAGEIPDGVKQYYDYDSTEQGYYDSRSGYDVPDVMIFKLKTKFSGKKVGPSVLASLGIGYSEIISTF